MKCDVCEEKEATVRCVQCGCVECDDCSCGYCEDCAPRMMPIKKVKKGVR